MQLRWLLPGGSPVLLACIIVAPFGMYCRVIIIACTIVAPLGVYVSCYYVIMLFNFLAIK